MFTNKKLIAFTGVAAAALFSSAAFAKVDANISLVDNNQLVSTSDVFVNVSFTNSGVDKVTMLKHLMGPNQHGDLEENLFSVTRNGEQVQYIGRDVKRQSPTEADYVSIAAGQTVSYKIELSAVYDLSVAGDYTFQYNAVNMSMFAQKPSINHKAAMMGMDGVYSNVATSHISGDYSPQQALIRESSAKRCNPRKEDCSGGGTDPSGIEFTGACSAGEQSDLISALAAAKNIANDSVSSLNGASGDRYNTWFGAYSASRHNTVASNFDAIKDALDNKQMTFDCSCNQSYFAYVYPNQPYKVYFCKAFWAARETGTDSRSGTIIHEISHFNAVAGTDDVVYGHSGAKSLAISNPDSAVQNADSHEYFAENTPKQN